MWKIPKIPTGTIDRFLLAAGILVLVIALILVVVSLMGRPIRNVIGLHERTLVFTQWWQDELEPETLQSLVREFEKLHGGIRIRLDNRPYMEIRDRLVYSVADPAQWEGPLPDPDILGLDPRWLSELVQTKLESLEPYRRRSAVSAPVPDVRDAAIASDPEDPSANWALPLVSFMIPLFYNTDILQAAGFDRPPKSWVEFKDYAQAAGAPNKNRYAFALSLSPRDPYGVYRDVFSWIWASGASMIHEGTLRFDTPQIIDCLKLLGDLNQRGLLVPDPFQKTGRDRLREFTDGRIAMMFGSVSDIRTIRDAGVSFGITTIPNPAGYFGKPGFGMIGWYAGISRTSKYPEEAWAFLQFLSDRASFIASHAAAVPGNGGARANYIKDDPLYSKAYDIYELGEAEKELIGFPRVNRLEDIIREELRPMLEKRQTPEETARLVQRRWDAEK